MLILKTMHLVCIIGAAKGLFSESGGDGYKGVVY